MNRAELDAWFAKADDVLTDWQPNRWVDPDAATWHASEVGSDSPPLPPRRGRIRELVHSEGLDGWAARAQDRREVMERLDRQRDAVIEAGRMFAEAMQQITEAMRCSGINFARIVESFEQQRQQATPLTTVTALLFNDQRERALQARRSRNTGPPNPIGMDGRRRR